ncbi:MAG: hypothetical protein ACR2NX_07395 [Chthoniobacterales bacterium]
MVFRENGQRITYRPPADVAWAQPRSLQATPAGIPSASATIVEIPMAQPQVFDDVTVKLLRAEALTRLPPGHERAKIIAERRDPVRIQQRDSYGVTIEYVKAGQQFVTNVLFADLEDAQLRTRTVAYKRDFEKVHRAFRGSLCTLTWR